ncbi:hypothetical protein ACFX13_014449 [Malus domestica]|nr:blue copper protein-like [Malus domestica]
MALRNTAVVSFIIMMIFFGACSATIYTVGGDLEGWTDSGAVDYNEWASSKFFYVGDEFIFNYKHENDFVMIVTQSDYDYCIPSLPLSHYGTFTALTFDIPGTYYVICGEPGHCKAGQKIKIKINALEIEDPVISPSPSPSPSSPAGSSKAMSLSSKITRPLPVLNLVIVGGAATALLVLVAWVSHFIYRRLNESMFQAEKSSQVV